MKASPRLLLLLIGLVLGGCNAPLRIAPAADSPQATATDPGGTWLVSARRNRVAARWQASGVSRHAEPPALVIRATNFGTDPLALAPGDVSVVSGGQPVRPYTPNERAREINRRARMRALSIDAQRHEEEVREQKQAFFTTETLPSPGPAMNAQAATLRLDQSVAAAQAGAARLFDRLAIPAGHTGTGVVMFHAEDIAPGQPLIVSVRVGDETHTFRFDTASSAR